VRSLATTLPALADINLNGPTDGWDVAEAFWHARGSVSVIYASGNPMDRSRCVPGSICFEKPYQPLDILRACVRLKDASAAQEREANSRG
jgi:hypothetical protein